MDKSENKEPLSSTDEILKSRYELEQVSISGDGNCLFRFVFSIFKPLVSQLIFFYLTLVEPSVGIYTEIKTTTSNYENKSVITFKSMPLILNPF